MDIDKKGRGGDEDSQIDKGIYWSANKKMDYFFILFYFIFLHRGAPGSGDDLPHRQLREAQRRQVRGVLGRGEEAAAAAATTTTAAAAGRAT